MLLWRTLWLHSAALPSACHWVQVKARIIVFSSALDCSGAVVIRTEKREPDCGSLQLSLVGAVISDVISRIPRSIGGMTAGWKVIPLFLCKTQLWAEHRLRLPVCWASLTSNGSLYIKAVLKDYYFEGFWKANINQDNNGDILRTESWCRVIFILLFCLTKC